MPDPNEIVIQRRSEPGLLARTALATGWYRRPPQPAGVSR